MSMQTPSDAPSDAPTGGASAAEPEHHHHRLEVAIAILLAVVAVTAALAAWRTSVVGSDVADTNRVGLIDVTKQQTLHHLSENGAYSEADYAVQSALKAAEAAALIASSDPALVTAGTGLRDNLVPSMEQLAGPFAKGSPLTPLGTFDIRQRIADIEAADARYLAVKPASSFALADDYSNEKRWLTLLSVLLAIALFWLGMAEITRGRWRIVNMVIGVGIWILGLGSFLLIEAWFLTSRLGAQ
jgi:hypothetical protein